MVTAGSQNYTFDLSGGRLCLDFANTVGDRGTDHPTEHLVTYADLVAWARQTRIVTPAAARELMRGADARPADAQEVLARAITLRETLYRLFAAVASNRSPRSADLGALNAEVGPVLGRSEVTKAGNGFALVSPSEEGLAGMLPPVVRSAVDLLTSDELQRVRTCAATTCAWLFLDTTRNQQRRWCDMKVCGNRDKVRRFRESKNLRTHS